MQFHGDSVKNESARTKRLQGFRVKTKIKINIFPWSHHMSYLTKELNL